MTSLPVNIQKYLKKYGISDYTINPVPEKKYEYIIVLPAIRESENIPGLLQSLNSQKSQHPETVLLLIVINNTISADEDIKSDNFKTKKYLDQVILEKKYPNLNIAYIDVFSAGKEMPDKEGGVGLARKIGMDAALGFLDYSEEKQQIIGCLDADCTVMPNYYDAVYNHYKVYNTNAGYVNYFHPMPEDIESKKAIICYEIFLRFYVFGLTVAESPYAFHTIGSTMNCSAEAYVKIGGMNKRKAAEDFYFMEKLSKITNIERIDNTTIFPSGRGSFRVPFGTGQRVNRYLAGTHEEYYIYNINSFYLLKQWVKLFHTPEAPKAEYYLSKADEIDTNLLKFLLDNNFESDWERILKNSKNEKQILLQKRLWFDGFKTLKLIHYLRDNGYPNLPMFPHLAENLQKVGVTLPSGYNGEELPELDTQEKFLNLLRSVS